MPKGNNMKALKQLLKDLIYCPTVSGFEKMSADTIISLCNKYTDGLFTNSYVTNTGSIVLSKKCGNKNAKKFCFDAHVDTIGFAVSEICSGGYIRLSHLGGIDTNILPSSEILVLGKEKIRGVFSSIPPHLSRSDKLLEPGELLVDTGMSEENLKKIISVGTPAMFFPHFTELLNDRISAPFLDDKICIAAALDAIKKIGENLENTDLYLYLSSGEERGGNGSHHIYEEIAPDALIVLDVNFAKERASKNGEYGVLSEGAMMSYSSVTSVKFTRFIEECTNGEGLQIVNEMTGTGTNADVSAKTGLGIPTAVLSIPIKYMHSSVELADMKDVISCSDILQKTVLAYDKTPVCLPIYFKGGAGANGL